MLKGILKIGGVFLAGLAASKAFSSTSAWDADEVYSVLIRVRGDALTGFEKQQLRKAVDDPRVLSELKKLVIFEAQYGPLERFERDLEDQKRGMSIDEIMARRDSRRPRDYSSMDANTRKAYEIFELAFGQPPSS